MMSLLCRLRLSPALTLALSLAALSALPALAQSRDVVAWLPFDGGLATDVSGNGNDGFLGGDPVAEPGLVGETLRLDGDDYVVVPSAEGLDGDIFSVSLYFRIDEVPASDQTLLAKQRAGKGLHLLLRGGTPVLEFELRDGAGGRVVLRSPWPVTPGTWVSLYAGHDGQDAFMALDGEEVVRTPAPGFAAGTPAFLLAGTRHPQRGPFFVGQLDELKYGATAGGAEDPCLESGMIWHTGASLCLPSVVDIAPEQGVEDTIHRHFGATLVDVDRDGWVDLYHANGFRDPLIHRPPSGQCPDLSEVPPFDPQSVNAFFLNHGDGTFGPDVAPEMGVDDFWNAMRHVWGDLDNDGGRDLLSHNFVASTMYRQVSVDPLLWEPDANLSFCLTRGTGASFADVDNDGFIDFYGGEYDPARLAVDHVNKLYLNHGDGTYADVTAVAGLDLPDNPMGVAFGDYDNDGDQDLFVTNSHEVPSRLYRNEGRDPFSGIPVFTDVGAEAGVAVIGEPSRGVGASWGDYDNDGRLDLLFSREEDSHLWHNDGPDGTGVWRFTDVSNLGGLDLHLPGLFFWGGNFIDIDNDGRLDILLTNRGFGGPGSDTRNRFFYNHGDGTWTEAAVELGVDLPLMENIGFVPGDIDNDGDSDFVIVSHTPGQPNFLFRNDTRGNNWVQFRLEGTVSNRDAVGARIEVAAALGPQQGVSRQFREISAGTGFFSDVPRIQTFGLGKAQQVERVRVTWPSGRVQTLGPFAINTRHDIVEPVAGPVGE